MHRGAHTTVHVVMPAGIDDTSRPSGGNRYDRRLCDALRAAQHDIVEHVVDHHAPASALEREFAELPDDATVVIDGLIASGLLDVLVPAARRLRLAVLVHMLNEDDSERAVLSAARAVITTSHWGRDRALALYGLPPERVHVARPGADPALVAAGTPGGGNLLCVGVVAKHKGHDVLLAALATIADMPWRLVVAGSLDRDPAFVRRLKAQAASDGIADRVTFTGALSDAALDRSYAAADVLVHPTRGEMYGMVISEALARGLPVIASDVGGVREALGSPDAGLLTPVGDPRALASALHEWLSAPQRRVALRSAARVQRARLGTWAATAEAATVALGMNEEGLDSVGSDETRHSGGVA